MEGVELGSMGLNEFDLSEIGSLIWHVVERMGFANVAFVAFVALVASCSCRLEV